MSRKQVRTSNGAYVFRAKEMEIEAWRFNEKNKRLIVNWINTHGGQAELDTFNAVLIETREGLLREVKYGDYVIRGVNNGEFLPCDPAVFKMLYEAILEG